MIDRFLNQGLDPNFSDDMGNYPLHIATRTENIKHDTGMSDSVQQRKGFLSFKGVFCFFFFFFNLLVTILVSAIQKKRAPNLVFVSFIYLEFQL